MIIDMDLTTLRYFGNALLLIGQAFLLYHNVKTGIRIKVVGALMLVFCFYNLRIYDTCLLMIAFTVLDLSKLFDIKLIRSKPRNKKLPQHNDPF